MSFVLQKRMKLFLLGCIQDTLLLVGLDKDLIFRPKISNMKRQKVLIEIWKGRKFEQIINN